MSKVTISDFLLAVSDLIEAQSNELKQSWSDFLKEERKKLNFVSKNFAFYFIFAVLFIIGFSLFCTGVYMILSKFLPSYLAVFIISFIFFIAAFIFAKSIKNE